MTFSFHPEAEIEFHETIGYYESCEPGLGYDFPFRTGFCTVLSKAKSLFSRLCICIEIPATGNTESSREEKLTFINVFMYRAGF